MQPKTRVAVILAGGLGTRLQSVVSDVPKPMAPVGNKPFLEIILNYWINQGIQRFILSVGYKSEAIINYFGRSYKGSSIEYVVEEKPLGTGGGLLKAIDESEINEQFLMINGDTFFAVDLIALEKFHHKKKSNWTLALFSSTDKKRYMQFNLTSTSQIYSIKSGNNCKEFYSNGGIYLIKDESMITKNAPDNPCFSLETDIILNLAGRNLLYGFYSNGTFLDIGVPNDYKSSQSILSEFL